MKHKLLVVALVALLLLSPLVPVGDFFIQSSQAQGWEELLGAAVLTNPYFLAVLAIVAVGGYVVYDITTDGPISTWFENSVAWSWELRSFMLNVVVPWVQSDSLLQLANSTGIAAFYDSLSAVGIGEWTAAPTYPKPWNSGQSMSGYMMTQPKAGTSVYVIVPETISEYDGNYGELFGVLDQVVFTGLRMGNAFASPAVTYQMKTADGSIKGQFAMGADGNNSLAWQTRAVYVDNYVGKFYATVVSSPNLTGTVFAIANLARITWHMCRVANPTQCVWNTSREYPTYIGNIDVSAANYPELWDGSWGISMPSSYGAIENVDKADIVAGTVPWAVPVEDWSGGITNPQTGLLNPGVVVPPVVVVPEEWTGLADFWAWLAGIYNDFTAWLAGSFAGLLGRIDNVWSGILGIPASINAALALWGAAIAANIQAVLDWTVGLEAQVQSWFMPTFTIQARLSALAALASGKFPLAIGSILACVSGIFTGGSADLVITLPDGFGDTYDITIPYPNNSFGNMVRAVSTGAILLLAVAYLVSLGRRFLGLGQ